MQKLIDQILKFGIVGVICFFIDFAIYTISCNVLGIPYLVAGFLGFTISVIVNYILSMKYVFVRRDDMSRTREFVIFVILSVIGLFINEAILYLCVDVIYMGWSWLNGWLPVSFANVGAKIAATGIVMVWNFVSRKIFLEKKQ